MISDSALAHLRAIAQQPDLAGTPYSLVRELARGGMAVVFEATDSRLDRSVALKVLALEFSSPQAAARMREEAKTIARLEHPGIVPIHDIGELTDGRVYYAMKLVRGKTLREFAAGERSRAGLLRLFLRICDAVAFAHAAGIVHRDLKPDNIMVGGFGEVLVMDWGVATAIHATGEIAGTKGFMAPEQLRGEPADRGVDIFALGVLLGELVTVEDPKVPRPLRAIVAKAADPLAAARYGDVTELATDVAHFIDGLPLLAYRENPAERVTRWVRRNIALVSIVVAYLVMRVVVYLIVNR